MNQQELDALLVATDMPRAVDAQIQGDGIKLRITFVKPDDPDKIAETWGKVAKVPTDDFGHRVIRMFGSHARGLIEEKRPSLVPYDSIYRADNDNAPVLEVAA